MKLRLTCASMILCAAASPLAAHDFWMQPTRFQLAAGDAVEANFLVGHGQFRERWQNNDRIVQLKDFFAGGSSDLRPSLRNAGGADLVARIAPNGLHVLGMQSDPAYSTLPAVRFNDYAKVEGLTLINAFRKQRGLENKDGRERYSRRAKSLVQVGPVAAGDLRLATRPIGLKLEIVPERNPYALDASRRLPVHVLYKGRKLAGATVKLTNLANDAVPVATALTDRQGRVSFRVPATGNWLINVVWGEPISGDSKVDFDTTFSSLTFGYPAR